MAGCEPESAKMALAGLLEEFRQGYIIDLPLERAGIDRHGAAIRAQWDCRFPGFPAEYFPFTSLRGQRYRGRRDAYLKTIIVHLLGGCGRGEATIVNPACVFGRHGSDLALRLPGQEVICTDIDANWHRFYRYARLGHLPGNLRFVADDIFDSRLEARPTAVVFFGACGSVSDGAIDYAIRAGSVYLMCRTCCHDNIGGNLEIAVRPTHINRFFRLKNWIYGRMRRTVRYAGFYFSEQYSAVAYPRSKAGSEVSTADEFQAVAQHSAESDICRSIIDLDRYLYLTESGYAVWYQGELFVAERKGDRVPSSRGS